MSSRETHCQQLTIPRDTVPRDIKHSADALNELSQALGQRLLKLNGDVAFLFQRKPRNAYRRQRSLRSDLLIARTYKTFLFAQIPQLRQLKHR